MNNGWGWMWGMGDGWGWGMGFGWIVMIALAILLGWVLITATRRGPAEPTERERRSFPEPSALEILERRYASGELSDDEFERMRQRLERLPNRSGDSGQTGAPEG